MPRELAVTALPDFKNFVHQRVPVSTACLVKDRCRPKTTRLTNDCMAIHKVDAGV